MRMLWACRLEDSPSRFPLQVLARSSLWAFRCNRSRGVRYLSWFANSYDNDLCEFMDSSLDFHSSGNLKLIELQRTIEEV
jgi:hypothetical protein